MVIGNNVRTTDNEMLVKNYNYDRCLLPEFYDCYDIDEISDHVTHRNSSVLSNSKNIKSEKTSNSEQSPLPLDGTIYVGTDKLRAIFPNGTLKWSFDLGTNRWIGRSAPAISADDIIYVGVNIGSDGGGEILAVNTDGTEQWRKRIAGWAVESSPCIGEDGTIYVGSTYDFGKGYLYAFGELDPNSDDVYYYIEWGDGAVEDWIGPYGSGEKITVSHTWDEKGNYTIRARAKDTDNLLGPWATLEVTMPKNQQSSNMWFLRRLERFPLLNRLLSL